MSFDTVIIINPDTQHFLNNYGKQTPHEGLIVEYSDVLGNYQPFNIRDNNILQLRIANIRKRLAWGCQGVRYKLCSNEWVYEYMYHQLTMGHILVKFIGLELESKIPISETIIDAKNIDFALKYSRIHD